MCLTCSGPLKTSLGSLPAKPFSLVANGDVVPRRKAFELDPRLPRGREAARRGARRLDLRGGGHDFGPGRRRAVGIEPRLLERLLVVEEHRRRAVERKGQHLSLGIGVVPGHRRYVDLRVEFLAGIGHHLVDRLDRPLRVHHLRRADLPDLQDRRRAARAIRGNRRRHRLGIGALEDRSDLVLALALVEFLREIVDAVVVGKRHPMPELDFGDGMRGRGHAEQCGREDEAPENGQAVRHGSPPDGSGVLPLGNCNSKSTAATARVAGLRVKG